MATSIYSFPSLGGGGGGDRSAQLPSLGVPNMHLSTFPYCGFGESFAKK